MEIVTVIRIPEGSELEKILAFLARYSELSFSCGKIRRELQKMDGLSRSSARVEYQLRRLFEKEIVSRSGRPGRYEYKIKKE